MQQQASILGNLEKFGVLKESCLSSGGTREECESKRELESDDAVVEFGAGRGYLTQVLADCYGIKKVLLVERKSYKLKVSIKITFVRSFLGKDFYFASEIMSSAVMICLCFTSILNSDA